MRVWVTPGNAATGAALSEVAARTGWDVRMLESVPERIGPLGLGTGDLFVHWSMEYHPVPLDLHQSPCRTVGVLGDWNLGGRAVQTVGGAFDLLVADLNGTERLRSLGFERVMYAPLWCYDPVRHRPLPGIERDIDILMVGSFNHAVQRARGQLLWRVGQMSRRWKVVLTSGVYGEEYTRLLNRARIVFNRSVRGEINMRVYETAACGALPFCEQENAEICTLLQPDESCVLYGQDDLEPLLEKWLLDEPARAQAARSAQKRVQGHTLAAVLQRVIQEADGMLSKVPMRAWSGMSGASVTLRHAVHRVSLANGAALPSAERLSVEAQQSPDTADAAAQVRAVAVAEVVRRITEGSARVSMAMQAAELFGSTPTALGLLHRGLLRAMAGLPGAAEDLSAAYNQLETEHADRLIGAGFPCIFDTAWVLQEDVWMRYAEGSQEWADALRGVLRWQAAVTLGEVHLANGKPQRALQWAAAAVECRPALSEGWRVLGRAAAASGEDDTAADAFARALENHPMDPDTWVLRLRALAAAGRRVEAARFAEDAIAVCEACPPFADRLTELRRFRERLVAEPLRLLANVNWNEENSWQPLVREFALSYGPADPVRLILPTNTEEHAETCAAMLQEFLYRQLGMADEQTPEIELVELHNSPNWVRRYADALVETGSDTSDARLPMIPLTSLKTARTMLRAA